MALPLEWYNTLVTKQFSGFFITKKVYVIEDPKHDGYKKVYTPERWNTRITKIIEFLLHRPTVKHMTHDDATMKVVFEFTTSLQRISKTQTVTCNSLGESEKTFYNLVR